MTLDEWAAQARAQIHRNFDLLHLQLQEERRRALARLERDVVRVAIDMARTAPPEGEQDS